MIVLHGLVICIVLLECVVTTLSEEEAKKSGADGQIMTNFANLLKTIVRVNEERVEAIRKIANLQDYMLTKNRLKLDDYYDSSETPETPLAVPSSEPPKPNRRDNEFSINDMCQSLYQSSNGQPTEELKMFCLPEAVTKCSQFCVHKFRAACRSEITCDAITHKRIIDDCQKQCKRLFELTDYI